MAVSAVGEDDFVWCRSCDYAANVEAARRQVVTKEPAAPGSVPPRERVHTPALPGIVGVAEHLGMRPDEMLKVIVFDVDGTLGLALVPGDREVNAAALEQALAPRPVRLYEDDDFAANPKLPKGYIGPDFAGASIVVADPLVRGRPEWVTGANEVDHHVRHAMLDRDFTVQVWADLAAVAPGDPCPRCGSALSIDRGIEVGHVFQLGTKYSEALDVRYTDESGEQHPMFMGCYGIGVSRIVTAVVEEHHDEVGITWPAAVAPYDVHLVVLPGKGDVAAEVMRAADEVYDALTHAGVAVLYDDRDASPGVKFTDADLLGMPVRLTLGAKGYQRGVIERRDRSTGTEQELSLTDDVLTVSPDELRALVAG
jgi:prolyl-tRNA synthetase